MEPKPAHLGQHYGDQFADPAIVRAYRLRPAYPAEAVQFLVDLSSRREALLDVGCGRGDLTIPLAPHFRRVDAVDPSAGMIAAAHDAAGPDAGHVRWIHATLSDADLARSYDLITAGQSLHWTDWPTDIPRLVTALAPDGYLALVTRVFDDAPWEAPLRALIAKHSTNREYAPYDPIEEFTSRGLFEVLGVHETEPTDLLATAPAYVEALHSANGFSLDRMDPASAAAFDLGVLDLLRAHGMADQVTSRWRVRITYGRPLVPG